MDGVDISSSSENGDENRHKGNSDPSERRWSSGSNLAMESDIDAELDYDEENGDNEEMGRINEQTEVSLVKNEVLNNNDQNRYDGRFVRQRPVTVEADHNERIDEVAVSKGKEAEDELNEEGEIDDLEEGELKSDEESVTGSIHSNEKSIQRSVDRSHEKVVPHSSHGLWRDDPASVGICKFYLRGTCTWGPDCKYLHVKEPRLGGSALTQSSSVESTYLHRSNTDKTRRSRSREFSKSGTNALSVYPSSSASNENERFNGDETAWEKGLRQARELMIRASKKREEPDFDRKRLVLAPGGDADRPRTTDEESDDSGGGRKMRHHISQLPLSRGIVRGPNGLVTRGRVDVSCPRLRKCDNSVKPDITGDHYFELEHRGLYERNEIGMTRKIPSLIDTMVGGRRFEFSRRYDCERDESSRLPPKDLGPQVLYPNGRPTFRRHGPLLRHEILLNEHSRVSRRDSSPRSPRSPRSRTSRSSRSPSLYRSPSPLKKRRGSLFSEERRETDKKRSTVGTVGNPISAGGQVYDPWERSHKKGRSKERELMSLTLGAELKKTRRNHDYKKQTNAQDTASSASSASRSASVDSSVTSRSRSHSRASSGNRQQHAFRFSMVSSKNLLDDDGSLRPTDFSSFRIPKKKRSSTQSVHRSGRVAVRGHMHLFERSNSQNKRYSSSNTLKRLSLSPLLRSGIAQRGIKRVKEFTGRTNRAHKRNVLLTRKDNMSSDEISSSTSGSSSSSSDDAEPAAYRLRKKVDDGLPVEGIPLSPEMAAEDVSSDEDENASDTYHSKKISSAGNSPSVSTKATAEFHESRIGDDDYVDNEAEKEERRAELLRQLKCVEEAIARKRNRPVI